MAPSSASTRKTGRSLRRRSSSIARSNGSKLAASTSFRRTTDAIRLPISKRPATKTARSPRCRRRVTVDLGAYPKGLGLAWSTWVMSTGPYIVPNLDYVVEGRLHQHDGQWRLSRRRSPGGGLLPRAGDGPARRRGRQSTASSSAAPTSSSPTSSPTPRSRASATIPANTRSRSTRRSNRATSTNFAKSRRSCASRAATSASVSRRTSRSADSVRGKARRFASSRAAKSRSSPASLPTARVRKPPSRRWPPTMIGADFEKVILHHGDTGNTPQGNGTGGSRGLAVGGAALVFP